MAWTFSLVSTVNLLPELLGAIEAATRDAAVDAAEAIAALASQDAPHATGALAAGIGVVAPGYDSYTARAGDAADLNPGADFFPTPDPPDSGALVAVAAGYGEYVELGTARGPAQPFLEPAAAQVASSLEGIAAARLVASLGEALGGVP